MKKEIKAKVPAKAAKKLKVEKPKIEKEIVFAYEPTAHGRPKREGYKAVKALPITMYEEEWRMLDAECHSHRISRGSYIAQKFGYRAAQIALEVK
jgi:hypothetical protein